MVASLEALHKSSVPYASLRRLHFAKGSFGLAYSQAIEPSSPTHHLPKEEEQASKSLKLIGTLHSSKQLKIPTRFQHIDNLIVDMLK